MPSCIGVFDCSCFNCSRSQSQRRLQAICGAARLSPLMLWFCVAAVGIPTEGLHPPAVVHTSLLAPQSWCSECLCVRFDVCILWKSLFNSPQLCCVEVNQRIVVPEGCEYCLTVVVFPLLDFLSLLCRDFLRIDAVSQILYFPLEEMALVRLQPQCWCNTKAEWHHLEFI